MRGGGCNVDTHIYIVTYDLHIILQVQTAQLAKLNQA